MELPLIILRKNGNNVGRESYLSSDLRRCRSDSEMRTTNRRASFQSQHNDEFIEEIDDENCKNTTPKCVENNLVFNTIFKTLNILGLLRQQNGFSCGKCVTFTVVNLYCLFQICSNVHYNTCNEKSSVFDPVAHITRQCAFAYIINTCLFHRPTIDKLHRVLRLCSQNDCKLPAILNATVIIGFLMILTLLIQYAIVLSKADVTVNVVERSIFNWNYLKPPWALTYVIVELDNAGWIYVQFLAWGAQVTLACTVECVRIKGRELSELIRNVECEIETLVKLHTDIFIAVQTMDSTFQFLLFIWLTEWVAAFCLYIPVTIEFVRFNEDLLSVTLNVIDTLQPLFCGMVLFLSLSVVNGVTSTLTLAFHQRVLGHSDNLTIYEMAKENYLFTKINTSYLQFRFLKCAVIDKNFIVGVMTAVVSYLLFLVSFFKVKSVMIPDRRED